MGQMTNLKIKEIVKETDEAVSLYFKQPFLSKIKYKSGQFLTIILDIDGKEYRRAYSINTSSKLDKDLSVTVKRVQGGKVSNYINDNLKTGEKVKILKPLGAFTYEPNQEPEKTLILFAGGSGITPIMSIMKTTLYFEKDTKVTLFYCNKNKDSIIFKSRIKKLESEFPDRLKVVHVLENDAAEDAVYKGLLNEEMISEMLMHFELKEKTGVLTYICGPGPMMNIVQEGLKKFGMPDHRVRIENFTANLADVSGEMGEKSINIVGQGKSIRVQVPPGSTILDAILDAGYEVPYSCMSGVCGTCKAKCKDGGVKMAASNILTDEEIAEGYVLSCIGQVVKDDTTIEI